MEIWARLCAQAEAKQRGQKLKQSAHPELPIYIWKYIDLLSKYIDLLAYLQLKKFPLVFTSERYPD
jgi:hypothetical protein